MRIGGNTVDETFWTSTGETRAVVVDRHDHPGRPDRAGHAGQGERLEGDPGRQPQAVRPGARGRRGGRTRRRRSARRCRPSRSATSPDFYLSRARPMQTDRLRRVRLGDQAGRARACRSRAPTAGAPNGSFQPAFVNVRTRPVGPEHHGADQPLLPAGQQHLRRHARRSRTCSARRCTTTSRRRGRGGGRGGGAGVPAVLDEGNSVVCEGQHGVSNVFASALWEIDDQLRDGPRGRVRATTARHRRAVRIGQAAVHVLHPAVRADRRRRDRGDLAAQPEYYGLAAVHEIGTGDFLNVTNPTRPDVHAYADQARQRHGDRRARQLPGPVEQRRHHRAAGPAARPTAGRAR